MAVNKVMVGGQAHHSHGLGLHHLTGGDGGEVRHVGQHVHDGHDGHGDDDGQGEVPESGAHQRSKVRGWKKKIIIIIVNRGVKTFVLGRRVCGRPAGSLRWVPDGHKRLLVLQRVTC